MSYLVFILTVGYTYYAYSIKIGCLSEELVNCTCSALHQSQVFVNCSNQSLNTDEVCSICSSMENVTKIDLSFNNITEIPEPCFKHCQKVTWLSLRSNNLRGLKEKTFMNMTQLKFLNLDQNYLIKDGNITTPEAFDFLVNLQSLSLKNNSKSENGTGNYRYLANISKNTFTGLQYLSLDGLPHASFGQNFQNLKNLTHVDLSGVNGFCRIRSLSKESFRNLINLTHLNLSMCQISYIDAATFEPLSRLQHLNLSYNMELGFAMLRNVSFGLQNTSIEVLDYSKVYKTFGTSNQLQRCDIWFLNNTNLKELRLNDNRISGIEVNGLHLFPRSLEILRSENNNWIYGPYISQFGCVSNLKLIEGSKNVFDADLDDYNKELHIKENKNVDYGDDACQVPKSVKRKNCPFLDGVVLKPEKSRLPANLENLTIARSNLYFKIPDYAAMIQPKNNIKYLDASSNVLYQWLGYFFLFNKLEYLDLSNNFCSNVTENFFKNAPNIENLNIMNNYLGLILAADTEGSIFKPLLKLKMLNLARNDIETLPKNIFIHNENMKTLNLSFNRIQKIQFDFSHMQTLTNLDVQQNKIYYLPVPLLEQMDAYSKRKLVNISIDMRKNPIRLSCEHLDFLRWMSDHKKYFKHIETYQFHEKDGTIIPFSEFHQTIEKMQKSCKSYLAVYIVSTISITTFLAILIGGFIYRFRWRLRYIYYLSKAKYTGYLPVQDSDSKSFQYDAFVSYADEDKKFVKNELVEKLENEFGLRLCIHERDFTPGRDIGENILQAIKNSRRTIIILSKHFFRSQWCKYEFNMARVESIYYRDGENILYVIMLEDVNIATLPNDVLECLENETYLKYQDDESEIPYFWERLKQGLISHHHQEHEHVETSSLQHILM